METNPKSRARIYFTILILFFCMSIAIITVFAVSTMRDYGHQISTVGMICDSAVYIQDAQLHFEKMRASQKNIFIYSGELEQMDWIRTEISESREIIITDLENCIAISQVYLPSQDADIIRNLLGLLEEYYVYTMEMLEQGMINDTSSVKEAMTHVAPLVSEIIYTFSELSTMTQSRTDVMWQEADIYVNQSLIIIIILSVSSVVLVLIASIALFRKTANSISDNQEEVKYSQKQYSENLPKSDTVLMSELERCVTDLKAITYDLSRTAKDIKK